MEKLSVAYLTIDINNANSRARHYGLIQAGAKTTYFTFALTGKIPDKAQIPQDTVIVGSAIIRNLPSRLYSIIQIVLLALRRPELFRDIDIFIC